MLEKMQWNGSINWWRKYEESLKFKVKNVCTHNTTTSQCVYTQHYNFTMCVHNSTTSQCVYTRYYNFTMCVHTTLQLHNVCTHNSTTSQCVYTTLQLYSVYTRHYNFTMCVHTTLQLHSVCTTQHCNFTVCVHTTLQLRLPDTILKDIKTEAPKVERKNIPTAPTESV